MANNPDINATEIFSEQLSKDQIVAIIIQVLAKNSAVDLDDADIEMIEQSSIEIFKSGDPRASLDAFLKDFEK